MTQTLSLVIALTIELFAGSMHAQGFANLYGENLDEEGLVSVELPSGNFIVIGNSKESFGGWPLSARCISATGEELWYETYSEADTLLYSPNTAFVAQDGNIVIGGTRTYSSSGDSTRMMFSKITPLGDLVWMKTYGGYWNLIHGDVEEHADGKMTAVGIAYPIPTLAFADVLIMRLNENGDTLWTQLFETTEKDGASGLLLDNDDLVLCGFRETTLIPDTETDALLMKLNYDGTFLWEETYNSGLDDFGLDVIKASDGGFILGGEAHKLPVVRRNALAIRTDSEGGVNWISHFGSDEDDSTSSLILDDDNNLLLVGYADDIGTGEKEALLMKIGSNGDSLWSQKYGFEFADSFRHILQTSNGHLLMTGMSEGESNFDDDEFVVLSDIDGFLSVESIPWIQAFSINPNPSVGAFEIVFSSPVRRTNSSLVLCDLSGRTVMQLDLSGLSDRIVMNLGSLVSGTYVLTLVSDNEHVGSRKLVKL